MPTAQSALDSLSNSLATPSQLENSSSSLDGVPADLETSIRYAAAKLTQAAGILLRLPQETIAQAIVIFSKFWIGPEGGSLAVYSPKVRYRKRVYSSSSPLNIEDIAFADLLRNQLGYLCSIDLCLCEIFFLSGLSTLSPQCLYLPPI